MLPLGHLVSEERVPSPLARVLTRTTSRPSVLEFIWSSSLLIFESFIFLIMAS